MLIKAKYRKAPVPEVTVTFFEPCTDPENDAFGIMGLYKDVKGRLTHMDLEIDRTITIERRVLGVGDLIDIERHQSL